MKEIQVKKVLDVKYAEAENVESFLDNIHSEWHLIDAVNWPEYPYCPEVCFRLGYTDDSILLQYKVREQAVLASCAHDNEDVWNDSCVEFFVMPGTDGSYYNIESNCIGSALIGHGYNRTDRLRGDESIVSRIKKYSTLGKEPFAEKSFNGEWRLSLVIPFTVFFKDKIDSLDNKIVKVNFYKCGDHLSVPHFLSWNPIDTLQPDFHQPSCFGQIEFI